jgi:hypothetical protein
MPDVAGPAITLSPPSRSWAVRALAWFLGGVFVLSAVAKMLSLSAFELYVVQQKLLPSRELAAYAVRGLLAAELFLGLACFTRAWFRRLTLPAMGAMLLGFSVYLAYLGFVKGDTESCHCFGELLPMSPLHSLVKNVALLTIVGYLYKGTQSWPRGRWWLPAVLAVISALVVGLGFPVRHIAVAPPAPAGVPAPPQESRFARFREFDGRSVDLAQGVNLVAFVSLDCEHCQALVTRLGEVARQQALPPVYLLCLGDAADAPLFLAETGSDFPAACIEPGVFFDYIGEAPPRLYLLQDGQPRAFWDEETFAPTQLAPWWPLR